MAISHYRGLSYNGIQALSQVYSRRIGIFFFKKRKEKRLGMYEQKWILLMYLRGIQYDTYKIHEYEQKLNIRASYPINEYY